MKLTKTILAVAIAGVAAAPMMASASTKLSGVVQVKLAGDSDGNDGAIAAGDVNFGLNAEQALNNGLTGYGNLQLNVNSLNADPATIAADGIKVGIKGGFGDVSFGSVGNPGEYGQLSDLRGGVYSGFGAGGIMYEGSFGGATVGVAYSPKRNADSVAAGVKFAYNGLDLGLGFQQVNGDDEAQSVGAKVGFAFAGASIGLGYNMKDANGDETNLIHAKAGYSIAGVSLGVTYGVNTDTDANKVEVTAKYGLGGGMDLSAAVASDDAGDDTDAVSSWNIKLSKGF